MFRYYNPNPRHNNVGDCTIRALTMATGKDWESVYAGVTAMGFYLADMPSANHVWGAYLKKQGFSRHIVDDHEKDVYTVEDFCKDNPRGLYVLGMDGHVVCIVDGMIFDSWDSRYEKPIYYWVKDGTSDKME